MDKFNLFPEPSSASLKRGKKGIALYHPPKKIPKRMHVTMYDDMAIQWMFEIFEIQKAQEVSEQRVQYVFEEPKIMPLISFYLFVVCFEN